MVYTAVAAGLIKGLRAEGVILSLKDGQITAHMIDGGRFSMKARALVKQLEDAKNEIAASLRGEWARNVLNGMRDAGSLWPDMSPAPSLALPEDGAGCDAIYERPSDNAADAPATRRRVYEAPEGIFNLDYVSAGEALSVGGLVREGKAELVGKVTCHARSGLCSLSYRYIRQGGHV